MIFSSESRDRLVVEQSPVTQAQLYRLTELPAASLLCQRKSWLAAGSKLSSERRKGKGRKRMRKGWTKGWTAPGFPLIDGVRALSGQGAVHFGFERADNFSRPYEKNWTGMFSHEHISPLTHRSRAGERSRGAATLQPSPQEVIFFLSCLTATAAGLCFPSPSSLYSNRHNYRGLNTEGLRSLRSCTLQGSR